MCNKKNYFLSMLLCCMMLSACSVSQALVMEEPVGSNVTTKQQSSIIPDGNWRIYCKGMCPDGKTPCFAVIVEDELTSAKDIKCNCVTCQRVVEPLDPAVPMPTDIDIPVDAPLLLGYATDYMKAKHQTDVEHLGITSIWYSSTPNNTGKLLIEFIVMPDNGESYVDAVYYDIQYTDNTRTMPSKVRFMSYGSSNRDHQCNSYVDQQRLTLIPTGADGESCGITTIQMNLSKWENTPDFFKE